MCLSSPWISCLFFAAPLLSAQTQSTVLHVTVPATSNPYLAGMPRGTTARYDDRAPEQSPVLVDLSLCDAVAFTFQASGAVEHGPCQPPELDPPNGSVSTPHYGGSEHGISEIVAPINSLIGVFLDNDRPDRTRAPKPIKLHAAGIDLTALSPRLKQVFFIGSGSTKAGVRRRYLVPTGATRLFLATMDGFGWWNNQGSFSVAVTVERPDVSSNMYSVGSSISFAKWACLPDRSQCTPDRAIVEEKAPGRYHVLLPAQLEWGAGVPNPRAATSVISGITGTVCLDAQSRSTSSCLSSGTAPGALITKTENGRTYFSVKDRPGASFQSHEGYFEFDVTIP